MKYSLRFLSLCLALICAVGFVGLAFGAPAALGAGLLVAAIPTALNPPSHILGAATAPILTAERASHILTLPLAADTKIFAGTLVARDSAGRAVPASDAAGLRVVGRADDTVDNTDGAAGALSIPVRVGCFKFANSVTNAIDPDDVGKLAHVEDNETVAETSTHKVAAGRIVEVESDGVWVDTRYAFFGPKAVSALASVQEETVNGSDAGTTQTLVNSLKAKYNTLQADVAALHASLFG